MRHSWSTAYVLPSTTRKDINFAGITSRRLEEMKGLRTPGVRSDVAPHREIDKSLCKKGLKYYLAQKYFYTRVSYVTYIIMEFKQGQSIFECGGLEGEMGVIEG